MNYYKVDVSNKKIDETKASWSAQKFTANKKRSIFFIHHETGFYFTLFNIEKEDINNIDIYFCKGIIEHLERFLKLTNQEKSSLKKSFSSFSFYDQSNNRISNAHLKVILGTIKLLGIMDSVERLGIDNINLEVAKSMDIEKLYKTHDFLYDKEVCNNFLKSIIDRPIPENETGRSLFQKPKA